jgi:Phage gp6-like head-tail connector protein
MTDIVTLDQAKSHLRVDGDDEDDLIAIYLAAAIQSAMNYLDRQVFANEADMASAVTAATAGDDPIVATPPMLAAILLILGKLYLFREDVVTGTAATVQELPSGSRALLTPYRVGMGA